MTTTSPTYRPDRWTRHRDDRGVYYALILEDGATAVVRYTDGRDGWTWRIARPGRRPAVEHTGYWTRRAAQVAAEEHGYAR